MPKRLSMKPAMRASLDFLVALGVFTLILAAVTADSTDAWSLQPPAGAAISRTIDHAQLRGTPISPAKITAAKSPGIKSPGIKSAGILAIEPSRRPQFVSSIEPNDRVIAIIILATMFSLISTVVLGSTRHLRRVIASPRRSEWGRS